MSQSSDTNLYIWTIAWDLHAFLHQPFSIFDANIFYPFRHTLAYSENLIGSALLVAPLLWMTGNAVLTMNAAAIVTVPLCALGAYVLARRLGVGVWGAVIAGLVYGFSPPRFLRLDQLHLTNVQWIPFSLAYAHSYLETGRPRDVRIAMAFFTLQVLTSGHGAVFLIVALILLAVYRAAFGEPIAVRDRLRDVGVPGLLLLAPAVLILLPYRAVQVEMGLRRTLEDWRVPWASFLAAPTHVDAWLLAHLLPRVDVFGTAGAYLFPGVLTVLLAGIGIVWRDERRISGRRHDMALFYALLFCVFFWLSIGPPFGVWQYVYWLPGFDFIRAPSRFMIPGVLALGVLAGFGFDSLARRLSERARAAAGLGIAAAMAAEFLVAPLPMTRHDPSLPATDRWLASQPKPFVVAEVPVPDSTRLRTRAEQESIYVLHSMAHWQKTVHGYSGLTPAFSDALYSLLAHFPDDESVRALQNVGVTYVVVHDPAIAERADAFPLLRLEHAEADGQVYRVIVPSSADRGPTRRQFVGGARP